MRKLRVEYPGASYHVINRGNYRQSIFEPDDRKESFRQTLIEVIERYGWELHAYVIMGNHFHLCVSTPEPNLSLGMKWLQGTWAMRANRFRKEQGRPFQGRYKGILVEPERIGRVCSYIHLNPYRAGLETTETLGSYNWCSLHALAAKGELPWISWEPLNQYYGSVKTLRGLCSRHFDDLKSRVRTEPESGQLEREEFERGWFTGSPEFEKEVSAKMGLKEEALEGGSWLGLSRKEHDDRSGPQRWTRALQDYADQCRVNLKALPPKKSAREKAQLAYLMKKSTPASNAWLAEHLEMGKPGSVTQVVKRFEASLSPAEKAALKRKLPA